MINSWNPQKPFRYGYICYFSINNFQSIFAALPSVNIILLLHLPRTLNKQKLFNVLFLFKETQITTTESSFLELDHFPLAVIPRTPRSSNPFPGLVPVLTFHCRACWWWSWGRTRWGTAQCPCGRTGRRNAELSVPWRRSTAASILDRVTRVAAEDGQLYLWHRICICTRTTTQRDRGADGQATSCHRRLKMTEW